MRLSAEGPWIDRGACGLRLESGFRVAVVGGGPAGSFFSYFLLRTARAMGINLCLDIYEPRDFSRPAPRGCNMCAGVLSESLIRTLAVEGISLPESVVQCKVHSYTLHTDVGQISISPPLHDRAISVVYRGAGPRDSQEVVPGLDACLLSLAVCQGARLVPHRVHSIRWNGARPEISVRNLPPERYDLMAMSVGLNGVAARLFEEPPPGYRPPVATRAGICELRLGRDRIEQCLGTAMHVFLLNIPRLEFGALIPKGDYVTVCLLGREVDNALMQSFLHAPAVRAALPGGWEPPTCNGRFHVPSRSAASPEERPLQFCHCSPLINVRSARRPFADRLVFVGDCAATRLYKDGIGAAYRTAKAAAETALFEGISARDFERTYWPVCQGIIQDNLFGRLIFAVTSHIRRVRHDQRGLLRMVLAEKDKPAERQTMSNVLWDTFTGSSLYRDVFMRTLSPSFVGRSLWHGVRGFWPLNGEIRTTGRAGGMRKAPERGRADS